MTLVQGQTGGQGERIGCVRSFSHRRFSFACVLSPRSRRRPWRPRARSAGRPTTRRSSPTCSGVSMRSVSSPFPHPRRTAPTHSARGLLSRSGVACACLRSVCKAGGRPQPVDADQGDLQARAQERADRARRPQDSVRAEAARRGDREAADQARQAARLEPAQADRAEHAGGQAQGAAQRQLLGRGNAADQAQGGRGAAARQRRALRGGAQAQAYATPRVRRNRAHAGPRWGRRPGCARPLPRAGAAFHGPPRACTPGARTSPRPGGPRTSPPGCAACGSAGTSR